ncbi:hypothetical protein [Croceicoccus naphthovorans]|uniref:hypothetical protein n=1 Tax=Croceicoccus naphthovorans TaxID=1348774 RepID=UPI000A3DDFFE|nr:hypothetical protein [Croceicoccus naphthovorans]MBB3990295.1 hypothetical protein [Croceicoccus naphthovorans]
MQRPALFTRQHAKRAYVIRFTVTATFVVSLIDATMATPVAIAGNLIWLWADLD